MKPIYVFTALLLSALTLSSKSYSQDKFPDLEGPYLGQKPPGLTPEVFAPGIVSKEYRDWTGFFTPDMKEDGYGDKDLYISFSQLDGKWGNAINLGSTINTDGTEASAYVSPDGEYLFFNRKPMSAKAGNDLEGDIYWVDAQVIETLRQKQ